jgi:hypothetical protein
MDFQQKRAIAENWKVIRDDIPLFLMWLRRVKRFSSKHNRIKTSVS